MAVGINETNLSNCTVNSREQNTDSSYLNDHFKDFTKDRLVELLNKKTIAVSNGQARATIDCRINVTYGDRSMRYWSGAGEGKFEITLELKDSEGKTRHSTNKSGILRMGIFGGDMAFFGRDLIKNAISEFGYGIVAASSSI